MWLSKTRKFDNQKLCTHLHIIPGDVDKSSSVIKEFFV